MSNIVLSGDTSGTITLDAPAVAGTNTLMLPAATGTIALTGAAVTRAQLPAGSILQVVSTTKTDTFSSSAASFTDITGLSVSITPTSSTSKILVLFNVYTSANQNAGSAPLRLVRNSTAIDIGDAASSRPQVSGIFYTGDVSTSVQASMGVVSNVFLDSPATTSSVTYKMQLLATTSGLTMYVNRTSADRDTSTYDPRTASSITVMEIAA